MKIDFPKIVREIDLADYAPEMQVRLKVWVNPPLKLLTELDAKLKGYIESEGNEGLDAFLACISEILSQGEEETRWTAEELREMVNRTIETDPAFWPWVQGRIFRAITEHRTGLKKA